MVLLVADLPARHQLDDVAVWLRDRTYRPVLVTADLVTALTAVIAGQVDTVLAVRPAPAERARLARMVQAAGGVLRFVPPVTPVGRRPRPPLVRAA